MSSDACKQDAVLILHINSGTPNFMTQPWDFAAVIAPWGRLTAHHVQFHCSQPKQCTAELEKCREGH